MADRLREGARADAVDAVLAHMDSHGGDVCERCDELADAEEAASAGTGGGS